MKTSATIDLKPLFRAGILFLAFVYAHNESAAQLPAAKPEIDFLRTGLETGISGGRLVVSLTAEPKTLNPLTVSDDASKIVIGGMVSDLIHINRFSQLPEPALAKSWSVSADGRKYIVNLRHGLQFSDGTPLTADDVVFSFQVYLDERVHAPQRDLLLVDDKPIVVRKVNSETIVFELSKPYGPGVRLFDSFAILPRHLLEGRYRKGALDKAWTTASQPAEIAGTGPFRLKQYVPGQKLLLERNPFYWKVDQKNNRLPYLNEIVFLFISNQDAAALRFQSGEIDLISHLSTQSFASLQQRADAHGIRLLDAGASLEWNFLFFNLNDAAHVTPEISRKQKWFSSIAFRQAVSAAVDRPGLVRLIYQGKASAIWSPVTPGNKLWLDTALPRPGRSIEKARQLLRDAGFSWREDGALLDSERQPVQFSIVGASSNPERMSMATMIQEDLRQIGMHVDIVPLEFRALLNRILDTHDYEACILGLGSGDTDPNADSNVWLSNGETHLWNLHRAKPSTSWEAEIDDLMGKQITELAFEKRKKEFDRVQELLAANQPLIFLVSPHVLVGVKDTLGNFRPAVMDPVDLWNVDDLYWKPK
jgi:peptide/nickel transport system substrate-binding protein